VTLIDGVNGRVEDSDDGSWVATDVIHEPAFQNFDRATNRKTHRNEHRSFDKIVVLYAFYCNSFLRSPITAKSPAFTLAEERTDYAASKN